MTQTPHTPRFDVCAVGNAIVDVLSPCDDAFLAAQSLTPGSMRLVDEAQSAALYDAMAAGVEASGGSAGNTVAGVGSFGGEAAYVGKVAPDALGDVFTHDIRAAGVHFDTPPLEDAAGTGRCLINVTADGQRTMCTFLGAANQLGAADIDAAVIGDSAIVYLEGYLFDPAPARAAFEAAAAAAHAAGRKVAITLSDTFVVARWRAELLAFIAASADIVLANESELAALFETPDTQAGFDVAADRLAAMVEIAAITRGAHGSVIVSGDRRVPVAAYPVDKVVDTTGAGDQYAAGFLLGVARGLTLGQSGELGSLAAAEVIAHWGPRPVVKLSDLAAEHGLALQGGIGTSTRV